MSKTRTNAPNNTAARLKPRMCHVSKEYIPINDPKTGLLMRYAPRPGVTFFIGSNALKRTPGGRRQSVLNRVAARRLDA